LFVPEALTLSYVETDFKGLLEITNRQVLITRVYAGKMWRAAACTHLLYCLTLLLGFYLILAEALAQRPSLHLMTLTFLPLVLSAIRGGLRLTGVTEVLPDSRPQITGQAWVYMLLTIFVPFFYLVNFANSSVTRKIRWRGMRYELISPQQTRIL